MDVSQGILYPNSSVDHYLTPFSRFWPFETGIEFQVYLLKDLSSPNTNRSV